MTLFWASPQAAGRFLVVAPTGTSAFQSTHPVRGGTIPDSKRIFTIEFQSTHPVRGGTMVPYVLGSAAAISIHPPREGWDPPPQGAREEKPYFNPPTP